jgi:hypothetical protein
MNARERLRQEVTKGNIWGEPHNLDGLINDVIREEWIHLIAGVKAPDGKLYHPDDIVYLMAPQPPA